MMVSRAKELPGVSVRRELATCHRTSAQGSPRATRPAAQGTFDDNLKHTHNLAKLWAQALPLIQASPATEARPADLTTVTKLIGQLTTLDPDGQELRYHERTDGKPSLQGHPHIDMPKFHESLQGVAAFLDGITEGIHQALDSREIWLGVWP